MKSAIFNKFILAFVLSVTSSFFVANATYAAPACGSVFTNSAKPKVQAPPKGLFNKIKSREEFKALEPQIREMINYILVANKNVLDIENILSEITPTQPFHLQLVDLAGKTNYALVRIKTYTGNFLDVRTNGQFVFLSTTYKYRSSFQTRNYLAVGMNGQRMTTYPQTDLILSTLPNKITLSRNLEEAERTVWLKSGKFVGNFGPKVHFAPNHYLFKETEPYRVEISKEQLLEFHQRNELEINIYDAVNLDGIKRMQTTDIGIEFEYVFVGETAIERLRPIMKEQLQQGVLIYK